MTSTQVLAEFYLTVTRKLKPALSEPDAAEATRLPGSLPVVATDRHLALTATHTGNDHRINL